MLGIEVEGPVIKRSRLEAAQNRVRVVLFCFRLRHERRGRVGVESESANGLFDASSSVSISEMNGVVLIELVVAFDCVLDFSVLGARVYVTIAERDRIRPRATRESEEISEQRRSVDVEGFDFECIRESKFVSCQPRYPNISQPIRSEERRVGKEC